MGCAVQSTPDGGEKDKTPPLVVATFPENGSTHFNSQTIEIEFDEYVRVDGLTSQFISSPPLKYKIEHRLSKKSLILTFTDTLRENTTYTFSFGNAIKDITENNVQNQFKYVFSTGAVLDSQQVTGHIYDAFSNLDKDGIMVALYSEDSDDSVFMKETPMYYGLTDEKGHFSIENVAPGGYKLVALSDIDFNYMWSGAAENLGFVDTIIRSQLNPDVSIPLFKAETPYAFYRGKYSSFGKIEMYFSKPAGDLQITRLDTAFEDYILERPKNGDTLIFWTNTWKIGTMGEWLVKHLETETVDTMRVNFTSKDTTKFRLAWKDNPPFSPSDSLQLISTTPMVDVDPSKILLLNDTLRLPFEVDINNNGLLFLSTQLEYGQKLKWVLDSGAVRDLYGRYNDSLAHSIAILNDNDLSIFHMKVNAETNSPKVIEIFNEKNEVLYRSEFSERDEISLYDIHPQKLRARIIYDTNQNGKWDTGNYFESIQPEKVIYLNKSIELRANWEIEENWNIR